MTNEELIKKAKELRVSMDSVLQQMKDNKTEITASLKTNNHQDPGEVLAQHTLSIRDLESAIMRQGMVLKNLAAPNPYPNSYNPNNATVEPTADGLRL